MPSYSLDSQGGNPVLTDSPREVWFKVKNTGTDTWNKTGTGRVLLGTANPLNRACAWRDPNDPRWVSSTNGNYRVEMEETSVGPNQFAVFRFNIAPQDDSQPGNYGGDYPRYGASEESFQVCREGVAFFTGPLLVETFRRINIEFPYSGQTNAFKVQLHAHTDVSDGDESPATVVAAYRDLGYDAVAVTDHNFRTPDPQVSGITFIPGLEEFQTNARSHLLVIDDDEAIDTTSATGNAARHGASALLGLAHPNYLSGNAGWTEDQIDVMKDFRLFEVYNGKMPTAAELTARGKFMRTYANARKVWCIAVDDSHAAADRDKGWIIVHAVSSSRADLLDAIRRGDFYASTGSEMTLTLDENVLTATSPFAGSFRFVDASFSTPLKLANNTAGGSVSYEIKGQGNAVWVIHEKTGSDGYTDAAWSQPVFVRKSN